MIESTFDTGTEGWTIANGGAATFDGTAGQPPGSLRSVEGGSGVWYFSAPNNWLGDRADYLGGSLSYLLRQDGNANQFEASDVILASPDFELHVDAGLNPGTAFTDYEVVLDLGAGWKVGGLDGPIASREQIAEVLGDLTSLRIRGEFVNGQAGDASNLDNVLMDRNSGGPPPGGRDEVLSTFDGGVDGWSFVGDVAAFRQVPVGGNPGGYLEAADFVRGDTWFFAASESFLGDKARFSGGTLTFDLQQSGTSSQFSNEDVVLVGGGLRLTADAGDNPGTDWTSYALTFDIGTDWRVGSLDGPVATQRQIDRVLADLDQLLIRGEFISGADTGGIDNVVMRSPFFNGGGGGANVTVLSSPVGGTVLSRHEFFEEAEAAAAPGEVVRIDALAGVRVGSYTIATNGLTIRTDLPLDTVLLLGRATNIALDGANRIGVVGNARDNLIVGSDGPNVLQGRFGDDTLLGAGGDDRLLGFSGDDLIEGMAGNDRMSGAGGSDTMSGERGRDALDGGSGADLLSGGLGRDILRGQSGDDVLDGGRGNDRLIGNRGADLLLGGGQRDVLVGGFSEDVLDGGAGHDRLLGEAHDDFLRGGGGDDTLDGGTGDDTLEGGAGDDVFIFGGGIGHDVVIDFEDGDVLRFLAGADLPDSVADLRAVAEQRGSFVVLDFAGDATITFLDARLSDFNIANLEFI